MNQQPKRKPEPSLLEFAAFLAETPSASIPAPLLARAADCVLDCLGAAAAGSQMAVVGEVAKRMGATMGQGQASIWFTGQKAHPIAAATANAFAATVLDIDDGHRKAKGHAGAAVVSAALAVAEENGASFLDFLAAVLMGYEAGVRVAVGRTPERQHDTASGIWSGIGAAVAAARLSGASAPLMAQTLLIAEQHSPQLASAMHHGFAGATVKEGIPWSVMTGMYAAQLAETGFTGYPGTFDLPALYQPGALSGGQFLAFQGLYFKPYACCRWIHSALDGVTGLMGAHGLDPEAIEEVEVHTFERAVCLANSTSPETLVDAQFSIPFCVALAATRGGQALLPMTPDALSDQAVLRLARRVRPSFDPEMERLFPALAPARVKLRHRGETFERRIDAAFGDPTNPMDRNDLRAKFATLAGPVLGADRVGAIENALASDATARASDVRSGLGALL